MENSNDRTYQSLKVVKIGIYGNIILAIFKIVLGIFSFSFALIADGIDTTSDVVKSMLVFRAVKIASKPPSSDYPYGYGRAETIVTSVVGTSVLFTAILIFIEAIKGIEKPEVIGSLMVIGALVSILGKIVLSFYTFHVGKKFSSQVLLANAKDYLSDVFASGAVLIGGVLILLTHDPIFDPLASIIVSGIIGFIGVEIVKSSIPEIMEKESSPEMVNAVDRIVKEIPYAFHPHLVRIRKLGPYYLVDMHVELPGEMSLKKSHEIVTSIENHIKRQLPNVKEVIIHAEPIGEGKDANWDQTSYPKS